MSNISILGPFPDIGIECGNVGKGFFHIDWHMHNAWNCKKIYATEVFIVIKRCQKDLKHLQLPNNTAVVSLNSKAVVLLPGCIRFLCQLRIHISIVF